MVDDATRDGHTPGTKLMRALLIAGLLVIPLFATYLLIFDRQSQSATARQSIVAGWGGPQRVAVPVLVIPYSTVVSVRAKDDGEVLESNKIAWHELSIAPSSAAITTELLPQGRHRSIYDAVVYTSRFRGNASYALPTDLARLGVDPATLALDRAELRFRISDSIGLIGPPPVIHANGVPLALEPGFGGGDGAPGFHALLDGAALAKGAVVTHFSFELRGSQSLSLLPRGGDTRWLLKSPWQSPGFAGTFLPVSHKVGGDGFAALWRIGNLALGSALASTGPPETGGVQVAEVDLVTPVDLYSEIDRSVKYGFLFIGFTFLVFWLFDVVGGIAVATVEYVLASAGLVLFFVLLLAFGEVIGFALAYLVAAAGVVALLGCYSVAVLRSRKRAALVTALLAGLYGALYVLLGLEAYALLVGSLLLFAGLAVTMWLTRRINWQPG